MAACYPQVVRCVRSVVRSHWSLAGSVSQSTVTCQRRKQHTISQFYLEEPFHLIRDKEPKWMTAEEAVKHITSGE